jgi:hypothetical protein
MLQHRRDPGLKQRTLHPRVTFLSSYYPVNYYFEIIFYKSKRNNNYYYVLDSDDDVNIAMEIEENAQIGVEEEREEEEGKEEGEEEGEKEEETLEIEEAVAATTGTSF